MAKIYDDVFYGNQIIDRADAKISISSSAVLYGLSVYTVFPVQILEKEYFGFRLKDHYDRLINSARIIGIDVEGTDFSYKQFISSVSNLVKSNKPEVAIFVRASIHVDAELAGTKSRGLSSVLSMFVYEAESILPETARVKTSVWRRIPDYCIPSRAKVNGAYVNSVLAKQDAISSGYDDCIFLDNNGHVCELSAANIFLVRDGVLITPTSSSDILEGINRRTILETAEAVLGLTVEVRTVDLTELYIADELFACGTSAYVTPIVEVDGRVVGDGSVGLMTKKLQEAHKSCFLPGSNCLTKLL